MTKKYRVTLTRAEREELKRLLVRGKADVRKIKHAQILLKADEADGGPAWPDARIAEAFAAGITTVERVRQRFVEEGFASALSPVAPILPRSRNEGVSTFPSTRASRPGAAPRGSGERKPPRTTT